MISPFLLLNPKSHRRALRRFSFIGKNLKRVFPFVEEDLHVLDPEVDAVAYFTSAFLSSLLLALLLPLIVYVLSNGSEELLLAEAISFTYLFIFLLAINIFYPRAKVRDIAKRMDRDLSFVLNDILIQLRSGVLLYDALVTAASSNYGLVSVKLKEAIRKINQGYPEADVLTDLARTLKSSFLRKTIWQLSNALKVGGDISGVLESIDKTIKEYNQRELRNYLDAVNLLLFGYLLLGAVLPAIFLVAGVIVASVMQVEFSSTLIGLILLSSLIVQLFLVGYIRASKPAVIE